MSIDRVTETIAELHEENRRLRAENERLRDALAAMPDIWRNQEMSTLQVAQTMLNTARAALSDSEPAAQAQKAGQR